MELYVNGDTNFRQGLAKAKKPFFNVSFLAPSGTCYYLMEIGVNGMFITVYSDYFTLSATGCGNLPDTTSHFPNPDGVCTADSTYTMSLKMWAPIVAPVASPGSAGQTPSLTPGLSPTQSPKSSSTGLIVSSALSLFVSFVFNSL